MSDDVRIREASTADQREILGVLKAALGETPLLKRTPELFDWKHRENPFGESIVLVAEVGDRIAGVRAFMRWNLATTSGHMLRCVRAVDTATHPAFARRGIFRRLTMSALEVASGEGIHLVFNTPNPQSAAGYLQMGWKEVGWTGAMVRPRLGKAIVAPADTVPSLSAALSAANTFETPAYPARPPRGLRTPRTREYLEWRFRTHPSARYGLVDSGRAAAVVRPSVRNGRTETVVADLLGEPGPKPLRRAAQTSRSRYAATWFSRGAPEQRAAVLAGFLPLPRTRTLRLVARTLTELDVDVFSLSSWDLAVSDLELL